MPGEISSDLTERVLTRMGLDQTPAGDASPPSCGTTIPNGTYAVSVSYQNAALDPPATTTHTNVVISGPLVTTPPVLTQPAASATFPNRLVSVQYTLPDVPAAGRVRLTLTGATTCTLTMSDSQSVSFSLDADNVSAGSSGNVIGASPSGCTTTIPNGTYSVSVSYQDAALDPTAVTTHIGVVISGPLPTTTTTTTAATSTTTAPPAAVPGSGSRKMTGDATLANTGSTAPRTLAAAAGFLLTAGCALIALTHRKRRPIA